MLKKTERVTKHWQSRDTGNIGHKTQSKSKKTYKN